MQDLYILVPDRDIEETIKALLNRRLTGVRRVGFHIQRDARHDPGVRQNAFKWLRAAHGNFYRAMVVFDYHGCGRSTSPEDVCETTTTEITQNSDWEADHFQVLVLDPELEGVLWNQSPHFVRALGYGGTGYKQILRDLKREGFSFNSMEKPKSPKEAMEFLMRRKDIPRSSSKYHEIADKISLRNCRHPAFASFIQFLQRHFPS